MELYNFLFSVKTLLKSVIKCSLSAAFETNFCVELSESCLTLIPITKKGEEGGSQVNAI